MFMFNKLNNLGNGSMVVKLAGLVAVLMGLSLLAGCGSSESNNAALKDKRR